MRIRVGTSGFAYKEWKGHFYPEDLPASGMLGYYAERLETVEINNTFYRMPSEKLLTGWSGQVPGDFAFVLKASRKITHQARLKECQEDLGYLVRTVAILERKLGPLLFQLPPYLRKDAGRLEAFLELLPAGLRAAMEFRHDSWHDDEIHELLRARNVALVTADTESGEPADETATASYGYLRLRRETYAAEDLEAWAQRILAQPWDEAFVFFKHEDEGAGPRLASRLVETLRRR